MKEYPEVTLPNYSYVFSFEANFSQHEKLMWMQDNWNLTIYCVGIYLVVIFGGQYYMQKRPRLELRSFLILWNILLASFSIIGASRTIPEFVHILTHHGFHDSVCVPSFFLHDKVSSFWTWMFALSKIGELGDTLFVVLRKQPLTLLHWGHHAAALVSTWLIYLEYPGSARWFMVMNYTVHAFMYSYYALRAMGYVIPKQIAMCITSMQLLQMAIGCAINLWTFYLLQTQQKCHTSLRAIKLAFTFYIIFVVLFARFFHKAYVTKRRLSKINKATVDTECLLVKSKIQ